MAQNRFFYHHSPVYGWAVFDREAGGEPAWVGIYTYTEPMKEPDGTLVYPSCVDLKSEYEAGKVCAHLNRQYQKELEKVNEKK